MPPQKLDLEKLFTYHPPTGAEQIERYGLLREAAKAFAILIQELTPESAEQTLAIRKVQEAVMWANAGVAINEAPRPVGVPK